MKLDHFLREDAELGIVIDGSRVTQSSDRPVQQLKYYSVTNETEAAMESNLRWARTGQGHPRFQFVYLMLPTPCNQKCIGCFMGQDKGRLPAGLTGPFFSDTELDEIVNFAQTHGAQAIVYGGGGELFAWSGAMNLVEKVSNKGLPMVIFTNGTLLEQSQIVRLYELRSALIVSLRDTVESVHNTIVGCKGFRSTLQTIDTCLSLGMQDDNRLAIEIPVTLDNEQRVLNDLLPVLRSLGIVPWIEEFIQTSTSDAEKRLCHDFVQARKFFERASARDEELGIQWTPEYGQRMIGQPQCRRPLYSFAVFPSGDVMDCPSHFANYGNLHRQSLHDIIYSQQFREALLGYKLCPCSVFYTASSDTIPTGLPDYLEEMK